MAGIRATLEAYRVHFDSWFLERTLHEGEPSAVRAHARAAGGAGPHLPLRGRAVAAHDAVRRRQGPRAVRSSGETTYFANDVAYHENKLERGYDRMINLLGSDHHGYIARMKASMAALGDRPGPARDPDPPVRAHRRGRAARLDVQAPRRLRHARRPDRRDRRRRHALLHAQPLARLDRRPRRRARQVAGEGQPGLLRAVPPRALRLDPAPGRGSRRRTGQALELHAVRARADQEAAGVPRRGRRGGRAARAAQESPPTRSSSRRRSRRSTATARCATRAPTPCARCGSARCGRPRRSSPGRWVSWGSRRRTRCERPLVERLLALERGAVGLGGLGVGLERLAQRRLARAARPAPRARSRRRRGSSPRRRRSAPPGGRARRP